jgi:hypothetical protein
MRKIVLILATIALSVVVTASQRGRRRVERIAP